MAALGFARFAVAGHDRGARVALRMALDHPGAVSRLAVLDIIPTKTIYQTVDQEHATAVWRYFFLTQPGPLPEHLIGTDPQYYLRYTLGEWCGTPGALVPEAAAEYARCWRCGARPGSAGPTTSNRSGLSGRRICAAGPWTAGTSWPGNAPPRRPVSYGHSSPKTGSETPSVMYAWRDLPDPGLLEDLPHSRRSGPGASAAPSRVAPAAGSGQARRAEPVQQGGQERPVAGAEPRPRLTQLPLQDRDPVTQIRISPLCPGRSPAAAVVMREHVRHTQIGQPEQHSRSSCRSRQDLIRRGTSHGPAETGD